MPFGYSQPASWLREDEDFDRDNRPGAPDWFSLSGDVGFKRPNNRHDTFKVESLLGYGGYMDLEKSGGPLGLSNWGLEKPIKKFQEKNGLEVDGWLKPGGPTITKMKELYGDAFGGSLAPTPAMVDANAEAIHAGEDGFLYDKGPRFGVKPNKRLDGKAPLLEFERWNREWARGSGGNPTSLVPEYETYIRDVDDEHGHDPGLIFARDLAKQIERQHGPENAGEFAKAMIARLSDRPDLQRQFLGGPVPEAPPVGTFKPDGLERVQQWIDAARIAAGVLPKFAQAASAATGAAGADTADTSVPIASSASAQDQAPAMASALMPAEPDPKNLLEYGANFGLPGEEAAPIQRGADQATPNSDPFAGFFGIKDVVERRRREAEASQAARTAPPPNGDIPPPPAPAPLRPGSRLSDETVVSAVVPIPPYDQLPERQEPVPEPPRPEPQRPNRDEGDFQVNDPNQMAPVHRPEPRQPEPDWSAMSDEQLEDAEAEAVYRANLAKATLGEARERERHAKGRHEARSGESGKNIANSALEEAAKNAALGAILGSPLGPKGVLVGSAIGGAGELVYTAGKEAIRYGIDDIGVRRMGERSAELQIELTEAEARLKRIQDARAARRAR